MIKGYMCVCSQFDLSEIRLMMLMFFGRSERSLSPDMEKRATHATQGRGNFYIIAEISSTIGAKWMFSIKTRPLLCLK